MQKGKRVSNEALQIVEKEKLKVKEKRKEIAI